MLSRRYKIFRLAQRVRPIRTGYAVPGVGDLACHDTDSSTTGAALLPIVLGQDDTAGGEEIRCM